MRLGSDFKVDMVRISQNGTNQKFETFSYIPSILFNIKKYQLFVENRKPKKFGEETPIVTSGYNRVLFGFQSNTWSLFAGLKLKDNKGSVEKSENTIDLEMYSYYCFSEFKGSLDF